MADEVTPAAEQLDETDAVSSVLTDPSSAATLDEVVDLEHRQVGDDDDRPDGEEELSPFDLPAANPNPDDVKQIPLADIAELANYRGEDEYVDIDKLAETLHTQGQLQPCTVRPAPPDADHGKPWELVYGYRRKRAAELLEWETLRCEIREQTKKELLLRMLTENIQREDPSPVSEARQMKALIEEEGISQSELARQIGKHPSHVSHRLKILTLPETVVAQVAQGKITPSTAEVIASLETPEEQEKLAKLTVKHEFTTKKAQSWAMEVKKHELDEGPETMGEVEMVQVEDVTELLHLVVRPDVTDQDVQRMIAYGLLRNGMDMEMLDYLADEMGYPYEHLWDYIRELSDDDVTELVRRLALRFVSAPHRYYSLEPSLKQDLALVEDASEDERVAAAQAAAAQLPGAEESWDDWGDDDLDEGEDADL